MRKYKDVGKRILVLLLTICMVVGMLPDMQLYAADSDLSTATVELFKDEAHTIPAASYTYTGSPIVPYVRVTCNGAELRSGTDYVVNPIANNTNAGTVTVTVQGRGSYSGSASQTFTIQKLKIQSLTVNCALTDDDGIPYCFYDGSDSVKPEIISVRGTVMGTGASVDLTESDYTVEYAGNNEVFVGEDLASAPQMTVNISNTSTNYAFAGGTSGQSIPYRIYYNMASQTVSVSGIGDLTFNGSAQTPAYTVADSYNPEALNTTDYAARWSNNVYAGQATLTLTGIGEYKGTHTFNYEIQPASLDTTAGGTATVTLDPTVYDYTGEQVFVDDYITVRIGDYQVPEIDPNTGEPNYTVSYDENYTGQAGVNGVMVTGNNNLSGFWSMQFQIVNGIAGYTLSGTEFTYTGSTIRPDITVTDKIGATVPSDNYTIEYYSSDTYSADSRVSNPYAVGTYYIIIRGNENSSYSGTLGGPDGTEIAYTIRPKEIGSCTFRLDNQVVTSATEISYPYSGSTQRKTVTINDGNVTLVVGTHYTIGYYSDEACTEELTGSFRNAGTYYVRIRGLASYEGSVYTLHYTVTPKVITASMTVARQTYLGTPITPAKEDITLTSNGIVGQDEIEFDVIYCNNNIAISTTLNPAEIVVQLKGNYTTSQVSTINGATFNGTVTGTFAIVPKKLSDCDCNLVEGSSIYDATQLSFVYNGESQVPRVIMRDGSRVLTAETDYTYAFYNREACLASQQVEEPTDVGTYYVKIIGINTFASEDEDASIIVSFQITPRALTASGVTFTAENASYTGEMVYPVLVVKDGHRILANGTDFEVEGYYTDEACTIKTNQSESGYFYVRIKGLGNYDSSSMIIASYRVGTDINATVASIRVTGAPFTYNMESHYTEIDNGTTVYNAAGEIIDRSFYTIKYYADAAHTTEVTAPTHEMFINAGTVYIGIVGRNGYYGTYYNTCLINRRNISDMDYEVVGTYEYTGAAIGLSVYDAALGAQTEYVKLTYPLTSGATAGTVLGVADFAISPGTYVNNINAGTATVVLTGTGSNYTGTKTVNYTISRKSLTTLSNIRVTVPGATYTSRTQNPTVRVTHGSVNTALAAGTDYSVTYFRDSSFSAPAYSTDLTNAGTTYVRIEGAGNYTGVLTDGTYVGSNEYVIAPRDISETVVSLEGNIYTYSQLQTASKIPPFTVRYAYMTGSNYMLTEGVDYTYTPDSMPYEIGQAELTVVATDGGNFTGSKAVRFYYQGSMDNSADEIEVTGISDVRYSSTVASSGATFSGITVRNKNLAQVISSDCYTVTYENNKAAGTATVVLTGNSNRYWTGVYRQDFKITGTVADAEITIPEQIYTGQAYTADVIGNTMKVISNGYTLTYGVDYDIIAITNATEAALATAASAPTVTIQGKGDYFTGTATKTATFAIKYDINSTSMEISEISSQTYTGSPVEPLVTMRYRRPNGSYVTLTKDVDYTLEYYNNTDVASANGMSGPYVVITSTNTGILSTGSHSIPFSIGQVGLETNGYQFVGITEGQEFAYTGAVIRPSFTIEKNGVVLDPSNYTVSHTWSPLTSYPMAGSTETIRVRGIGNYSESIEISIRIVSRSLSADSDEVSVTIADQQYTGAAITPDFAVRFVDYAGVTRTLTAGVDYQVVGYYNNTNAAVGEPEVPTIGPYVRIQAVTGSSFTGTRNIPFTILPKDMEKLSYSQVEDMTYQIGVNRYEPSVSVKMTASAAVDLTVNRDYYVEYINNAGVGDANQTSGPYVRIFPASDNFTGEKIIPFTIHPKSLTAEDIQVVLSDPMNANFDTESLNYPYTPGIIYEPTVEVLDNYQPEQSIGAVSLSSERDYSYLYTNNTATGTAAITITGMNNYTGTRTVYFTIGTLFNTDKITVYQNNRVIEEVNSVVYDGTDKTPTGLTVKLNSTGEELTPDSDNPDYAIYYYRDAACTQAILPGSLINAGTYYVAFTGLAPAGYVGRLVLSYTIQRKNLNVDDIRPAEIGEQKFGGGNVCPTVELIDTSVVSEASPEGTTIPTAAYDVTYENNNSIGNATAVITANEQGNYTGVRRINFVIVKEDISQARVNTVQEYLYTGNNVRPDPEVYFSGTKLELGTDYIVTYGNNQRAGAAWMIIQGINNYEKTKRVEFNIKASLKDAVIEPLGNQLYTGSQVRPNVEVVCGGNELVEGVDYRLIYADNVALGDGSVTIEPLTGSYYTDSRVVKFIICNDISQAVISNVPSSQTYTKAAITPEPIVSIGGVVLSKGTDYTVQWSNDVNVGTAAVTVTGMGIYAGSKTQTYQIIAKSIARCTVDALDTEIYNTKTHTPAVVVRDGSKILARNIDYTVSYSSNRSIGTAYVTITGIGNYSGTVRKSFKIVSAPITGLKASALKTTSVKLSWTKKSNITGYQIYTNDSRTKLAQLTKNKNSITMKKLKAGTTYKYKVRTYTKIGQKTYFGAFTTITFSTKPQTPTITVKSPSARRVRIRWKRVSGANGYVVYRASSLGGKFEEAATVIRGTTVSYTNTGLTRGATYYYRVRAYRTVNGKRIYSSYSSIHAVTVR